MGTRTGQIKCSGNENKFVRKGHQGKEGLRSRILHVRMEIVCPHVSARGKGNECLGRAWKSGAVPKGTECYDLRIEDLKKVTKDQQKKGGKSFWRKEKSASHDSNERETLGLGKEG